MGLDMYASTTTETLETEVDFKPEEANELHYWRKHPDLHGWMEELYYSKGGASDCFNCVTVTGRTLSAVRAWLSSTRRVAWWRGSPALDFIR